MADAAIAHHALDLETIDMLRDSAEDFCRRSLGVERLRALRGGETPFDRAAWTAMCELGWGGILAPESAGGLALGASAVGAVCRQLGRVVAPEPMIECAVGAVALLAQLPQANKLLGEVVAGTTLAGAALAEPSEFALHDGAPLRAHVAGENFVLSGEVRNIALGSALDGVIVVAILEQQTALFYCPLGATNLQLKNHALCDGTHAATLTLQAVSLDKAALLGNGRTAEHALSYAREITRLAAASYLVGAAEAAFDMTLEYLKTRQQFGKYIGSFQALQHRAVDLLVQKTLASAVLEEALATFDTDSSDEARAIAASRAKYRANEAALLIGRQSVQLHGGIGYTDECDVGLYLNRILVVGARLGNASFNARRLHELLGDNTDTDGDNQAQSAPLVDEPANGEWDSISDEEFRLIVRHFLESEYPSDMRYPSRRPRWTEVKPWYMTLSQKGWVAPAWPAEHGGMGLSPAKLLIFIEEQERWGVARAPDMGIVMVGPLLIQHGTAEQRARYLPKILAGETVWCQGYSEPNAGSDLASLKTEALPDGDEFVINGQKTWTTLAQDATHMFCLARTSKEGKQQEGISFFLIDFDQPGITIRPIRNIAGHEEFCEVFLDNVRVPADCMVGEINQGWTIAKALLGFERIFLGSPKQSQFALMRLQDIASGAGLFDDPAFVDKMVRFRLDVLDLESTYQRFADIVRRGETLGPDVSLVKIWATETFSRLTDMMVETAGADGGTLGTVGFGDAGVDVMSQFYNARPATIYGGSNEIQRNIIAKGVLRLPS